MYPHSADCIAWDEQGRPICRCEHPRPWRVRKQPDAPFKQWAIYRRTFKGPYELHHRAASFDGVLAILELATKSPERVL